MGMIATMFTLARKTFRLARRAGGYFLVLLLMLYGLQYSTYPIGQQRSAIAFLVRDSQFDYVTWELQALASKTQQTLYGLHPFMSEADRSQQVRDYMTDLATAQRLESEVNAIFTDPDVSDPLTESSALRQERDALRADLGTRQPLVEAIIEGQVATVLLDEGFGTLGQLLPPISMRFTQVPNLLIVSPRDNIRFDISLNINPLPVDEIAALENRIDEQEDVSSLIVPLGGIALYPAMIIETTSISRAVEVFAHEWLHHYLFGFPLGLSYDFAGQARIINETTANLFGREIAPLVLARYYPELVTSLPQNRFYARDSAPVPVIFSPSLLTERRLGGEVTALPQTDPFEFGKELDTTRRRVDELLAAGEVEQAEAYMEERRALFVTNGYLLRKLNQAYFAFYGGYQSGAPGAGGSDPTGPAVQAIRDASPSVHDWIVTMRGITTRDDLLAARDAALAEEG